ncbi:MAG: efflux RND transporter periplasmic adaptor subunit [Neisseriaceae bacterium]|nr:MAG: efflux RND transporter periplasmic adaptor subunit [Neisseriaceae bacterium]
MKKILVPLMAAGLILAGCSKKEVKTAPEKHVDVQVVHAYNVPYVYDYPAIVQGVVDYPVIPRVSGAIFKQYYTEGTYVKKDTPLYQIDPRPFELDLQTYQGNLIRDKASMDNYKIIYERYVKLYAAQAVSKQDLELQTINYQTAVGNVKTDEANINQAKLNLEYSVVRAPADGYIAERQVTVGNMVTAWQTVMNQINSVNDMYITFSMPENDRLVIQNGVNNGVITVPPAFKFRTDLQLADGTMMKNSGYVQFTDTRISLQNGVWNMRAYVDNTNLRNQLLSGQFVHIYLNGVTYKDSFAIPQESVFRDDKGAFVYVVKDGKIAKQPIVTGPMTGELWIIKSGLSDGMKVVTAGGVKVMNGDKVIVDNTDDQSKINPNNPMIASAPKAVTPAKTNASAYKGDVKKRAVVIESSANIYDGKY